ncbi:MAG TPA: RNA polymerase sigma factor [Polyangia bacterium]|jgi:RNA polymerase sigma-70 factor (ECF subfamily)
MRVAPANTSPADVAALVEAARRGESTAFRELFRLHVARVHRIVYRLVGRSPDLDDLVQTVFVEGFRSLPSFRGESLFATWLGRIAVRVTMRAVKRPMPKLVPIEAVAELAHDGRRGDEVATSREGLVRLDALLAALKPKRRAAFVLHVLEGYSVDETAAMVGASVAAVKVRIHDARRELERRARRDPWFIELLAERGRR